MTDQFNWIYSKDCMVLTRIADGSTVCLQGEDAAALYDRLNPEPDPIIADYFDGVEFQPIKAKE